MASPDILTQYNEAAMLAQSYAVVGSICYRADLDQEFTLIALPPSVLANWVQSSQSNVRIARVTHTITEQDILNGFIPVPVVWPAPFEDTKYTAVFSINDLDETVDLSVGELDMHDKTASGITCVALLAAAYPLVQAQLDALDVATPQTVNLASPIASLYTLSVYWTGHGNGTSGDNEKLTLTFTDASGIGQQTVELGDLAGNATGTGTSYAITFPLYTMANTPITVATTLTAGSPFNYDLSVRIVQMPNNNVTIQPGDQFTINAIAIHD